MYRKPFGQLELSIFWRKLAAVDAHSPITIVCECWGGREGGERRREGGRGREGGREREGERERVWVMFYAQSYFKTRYKLVRACLGWR